MSLSQTTRLALAADNGGTDAFTPTQALVFCLLLFVVGTTAAIASRLMPRLMAWVAKVWRNRWAVTWPTPASAAWRRRIWATR